MPRRNRRHRKLGRTKENWQTHLRCQHKGRERRNHMQWHARRNLTHSYTEHEKR